MKNTRSILKYLEESAAAYPSRIAVTDGTRTYSYNELYELTRRIGSTLAAKGVIRRPVAVLADKGADTLAVFLGIVQAGGFYVLLNPELPQPRLLQIQAVLQAQYLITDSEHRDLAEGIVPDSHILMMDSLASEPADQEILDDIRRQAIDTDPLYANFTSGSTGQPKGVVVSHRSVLDFIDVFAEMFELQENDIIGNQAPFDFDVSVKDIYTSLKVGATLVIIPKSLFAQPALLLDFIVEHRVTVMIWAVSALCLISIFHGLDYRVPITVRKVFFSGEVMPLKHLKAWMECLPEAQFVNLYGPTEITCNCTWHRIERGRDYASGIPIGRPFPNEQVFLLDNENHEIREPDVYGEICVRGTALALGYYRMPEQTKAHFVQNPLNDHYPELIYRTGDIGRYNEAGELYFGGRKDFQVKYMGHRVELEEIERAMENISGVTRACCVFDENKSKLYGFYIGDLDKKSLHKKMSETLPVFMVPGAMRQLEQMPLTKNGKIDRQALLYANRKGGRG